jgi:hypothetical protein
MDLRRLLRQEFGKYRPILTPVFRSGYFGSRAVNKDVSKRA